METNRVDLARDSFSNSRSACGLAGGQRLSPRRPDERADVIRYEQDELGNALGITAALILELENYSAQA